MKSGRRFPMTIVAKGWMMAAVAAGCVLAYGCSRNCATCSPANSSRLSSTVSSTVSSDLPMTCGNADEATFAKIAAAIGNAHDAPRILMLSGGGSYGAWGAGVLNGWSERTGGQRPKFDLVTGASSGAILGTWAFLGSEADASARCAYTDITDEHVYHPALFSWIWLQPWRWGSIKPWASLKNTAPMRELFHKYTTMEQVEKVGSIYRNEGRVLLAGTVNIDMGAFCLWDMGKIAEEMIGATAERKQEVYDRYLDIVMASSSIPGMFNPTFLPSRIDGDMHVDGGVGHQIFFMPNLVKPIGEGLAQWQRGRKPIKPAPLDTGTAGAQASTTSPCNAADDGRAPRLYAIVNMPAVVPRTCTNEDVYHVALRSLAVLAIQSLIGDLHKAWEHWQTLFAGAPPGDLCVSRIPDDLATWPFADEFPECEMRELYATAEAKAQGAAPWDPGIPVGGPSPLPCSGPEKPKPAKCSPQAPGCD